jgi:hypothetical protein
MFVRRGMRIRLLRCICRMIRAFEVDPMKFRGVSLLECITDLEA